jgi:proteasome lid subunit RPN8/RPN11
MIRGAGEGSVTLSTGYRRSAVSATQLPTLFEELEPAETIELGHRVAETIRTDVAWTLENVGDAETGGWLLGRSRNYVLQATVPGGDSYATRSSIDLGYEQLQRAQRQHGDAVLGCWHWHGLGDDRPSDTDLRAWAAGARLTGDRWVSLIVTPSRSWRPEPEISGWQTIRLPNGQMLTERLEVAT